MVPLKFEEQDERKQTCVLVNKNTLVLLYSRICVSLCVCVHREDDIDIYIHLRLF